MTDETNEIETSTDLTSHSEFALLCGFSDIAQNLEILAEECAEVIQIKSKITRFGLDYCHPKNKMPNRQALVRELGDLLAMIDILKANGLFTGEQLEDARLIKLNKLRKWYT